jgi:hypothetical protein
MNANITYLFKALLFVFIQVFILNQISIQWWAQPAGFPVFQPFIYPLFILILPITTPTWVVLLSSFALGLSVDMFMNTGAIHAASLVAMGYMRHFVLLTLLPKHLAEYDNKLPEPKTLKWLPFLTYITILLAIHHLLFFILEMWSVINWGYLLVKTLVSIVTSLLLVLVYITIFTQKRKRVTSN